MKKISLLLAVLFLGLSAAKAQPQLEKGRLLLGVSSSVVMIGHMNSELVSLGFFTIKYKYGSDPAEAEYRQTSFNILPKAGYFVMDNLVAGLQGIASGHKDTDVDSEDSWAESILGVGPFVRYYYPLESFYPFAEVKTLFGTIKESWYSDDEKSPFIMLGISAGASLPLGDKVTLDATAGYSHSSTKETDVETEETVKYISGGFSLELGITIYL